MANSGNASFCSILKYRSLITVLVFSCRAVSIAPNQFLHVVGEHDNFPVENLSLSHCGKYVASCSHDEKVKFWDVSDLQTIELDAKAKSKSLKSTAKAERSDFFADLPDGEASASAGASTSKDDEDDSDDSDSSSDDDTAPATGDAAIEEQDEGSHSSSDDDT